MDSRKIILSIFLGAAALVWFLSRAFLAWLSLTFYQVRSLPWFGSAREVVPVLLGLATFIIFLKKRSVNDTLEEVISELKKVTWPGLSDVKKSTVVVVVCILLASCVLAVFDLVFGKTMSYLLKV